MKRTNIICICGLAIILAACEKDTDAMYFAPTVTTGNATDIYRKGATLSGSIELAGTSTAESYGILFSKLKSMAESTEYPISSEETEYEVNVQNLEPGTTYYYCAYANSGFSISRGEVKNFTTTENNPPVFGGLSIDSIGVDRIFLSTDIIDDGGAELLISGFCWKEGSEGVATYIDNVMNVTEVTNNKLSAVITGLKPESNYVVAAYSVNTNGMGFSESLVVTTNETEVPVLSPITPKDSTYFGVTVSAKVLMAGSDKLERVGFVWSASTLKPSLPTDGEGNASDTQYRDLDDLVEAEEFSTTIENLNPATTYYIRAYAVNEAGEGYSDVFTFTTAEAKVPTLSEIAPKDSADYSITIESQIMDIETSAIIQAGYCWSVSNDAPTIEDDSNDLTSQLTDGNVSLSTTFSDLKANTTYYIRAYVINAEEVFYSEVFEFTTASPKIPTLSTITVKDSTDVFITLEATIIDKGASELLKVGFCWGTANEPTVNNSYYNDLTSQLENDNLKLISTMSVGDNFRENNTYYIRAYATNDIGTSYSDTFIFRTGLKDVENEITIGGGEMVIW